MQCEAGTPIGRLVEREGGHLDIKAGHILKIGRSRSVAIFGSYDGFRLLVVLSFRAAGLKVTRNNRCETGAFLLAPGEEMQFAWDRQEKRYRFELLPVISARVDPGGRCAFCRSVLRNPNARLCTAAMLGPPTMTPALLCEACAVAWADQPPAGWSEGQTH